MIGRDLKGNQAAKETSPRAMHFKEPSKKKKDLRKHTRSRPGGTCTPEVRAESGDKSAERILQQETTKWRLRKGGYQSEGRGDFFIGRAGARIHG